MKTRQGGFTEILLVVAILVAAVAAGAYYLGRGTSNPQSSPSPTASPTQAPVVKSGYLKRQFDPLKKFFSARDYPSEVVSIVDSELVGMKCTTILTCVSPYTECTYYPEGADMSKPPLKNTDPQLLNLIKEANKTIDKETIMGTSARDVEEVTSCKTENGKQILRYKTGGGGGGAGSVDYIGVVTSNNIVNKIAAIQENTAYFGCYLPLQLTQSNILYYQCGGGDGLAGSSTIYTINLIDKTSTPLLQCSSIGDESGKVSLTCK